MTAESTAKYLAEQHERAVERIKAVTAETGLAPGSLNAADEKRLAAALFNIPMAGMTDHGTFKIERKSVEDLALFILEYGEAYGEALRTVEAQREEIRRLKAERKAVRDFFRGDV
jgi:hypothetical protein